MYRDPWYGLAVLMLLAMLVMVGVIVWWMVGG